MSDSQETGCADNGELHEGWNQLMPAPNVPGAHRPMGATSGVPTTNLGFPRMGRGRELKWVLERAWRGDDPGYLGLEATARELRERHWRLQAGHGLAWVPTGDFALYDHVLDAAVAVGAVPARFRDREGLDQLFAMARGAEDAGPLAMTKWFDTNYHYLVPELGPGADLAPDPRQQVTQLTEALALGIPARPVVLGPVTLARLSRRVGGGDTMDLVDDLIEATAVVVSDLVAAGASALQLDEPILATHLDGGAADALVRSCRRLRAAAGDCEITLATYFASLGDNTELALGLDADFLHVDMVRGRAQLPQLLDGLGDARGLSLGVLDGRNVWRSDLAAIAEYLRPVLSRLGPGRVRLAPSCSLLHLPMDLDDQGLDPELRGWLAFAAERLSELATLAQVLMGDEDAARVAEECTRALAGRLGSVRTCDPELRRQLGEIGPEAAERSSVRAERRIVQSRDVPLPLLPTTTIGSFPQTDGLRRLRARYRRGEVDTATYEAGIEAEIAACIDHQEKLGLDVLVHGEPERTDMVEHFAELLDGFATTTSGWVQSYGSRCVRPPILYGDVRRAGPLTLRWADFASGLTDRPVKAMLTGPVTMLAWSFVRDDQPEADTAIQVALALRHEVADLAAAGHRLIQIDEPALRESLPLAPAARAEYLDWSTTAFRIAAGAAPDEVAIHTHMCYSAFDEILGAVASMDADVISFEAARSGMDRVGSFTTGGVHSDLGPGMWDVHSPRLPTADELDELIDKAVAALGVDRVWINPDCGLKTRQWAEVSTALATMVDCARRARNRHGHGRG